MKQHGITAGLLLALHGNLWAGEAGARLDLRLRPEQGTYELYDGKRGEAILQPAKIGFEVAPYVELAKVAPATTEVQAKGNSYVIQLYNLADDLGETENLAAPSWAWMRESQMKALELPHTAVANTIDLGDLKNIQPKDKLPVAQRLALLAARDTLGQKIEAQSPVMNNVESRGNTLVVHFDHANGLKTNDGKKPTGFWLADGSKKWLPANAEITGQTVTLQSPQLTQPRYVRYAFAAMPKVNLVNASDLPADPFRTDLFQP